jgi:SAM-dependent methyltransferase
LTKAGLAIPLIQDLILHSKALPVVRWLRFATLRRMKPLRNGAPTGTQVVRWYWARFLERHRGDIRGRALEIGTTETLKQFGGSSLERAEALDLDRHSPEVAIVADLSRADHVPGEQYDCFLNQFTMCSIYDVEAAMYHSIRLLKPGGVLLVNFWSVDYYFYRGLDMGTGGVMYMHHWFTPIQVHDLMARAGLGEKDYTLTTYGNLLTRFAFLINMPTEELSRKELEFQDPAHPLLIAVRVVRPEGWSPPRPTYREPSWLPPGPAHRFDGARGHQADHYG